jgi:EAL domain-containing protein (putative c-di-GMP-specific phosphodiesterase class I)
MLYRLPFSNESLKFFPPTFTFRDPILSLIRNHRTKNSDCALLLFHLAEYNPFHTNYSFSLLQQLQSIIKSQFISIIRLHFKEEDIIGVKQFAPDDFTVFVNAKSPKAYDDLSRKTVLIRTQLEQWLFQTDPIHKELGLSIQTACYLLNKQQDNTSIAVQEAFQYAAAIATGKLPAHFVPYRQELIRIVQEEDIYVLTQPIMNLHNGDVFGWEVLTRGPQNSPFHSPMELFECAFQADLLAEMEFLAIKKAFQEVSGRAIQEQVFINITPITLMKPAFLDHLLQLLQEYPAISPFQMILEITERHAINDFEQVSKTMKRFRSYGFRFAVDDAGAGYSSLQSITELIPDIIKIDKSLIQNIDQLEVKQTLLKALLYFADNINCQVIAEGVEREEEANVLFFHQVQMGQGFYFARPEPLQFDYERTHYAYLKEKIVQMRKLSTA